MPNVVKLPSGNYRVRAQKNKKVKSFTATSKREALALANDWLENNEEVESPTLDEALQGYIESKEAVLSPSTIRGYEQIRTRYFDEIGGVKLSSLDSLTLQRFVSDLSLTRSPKTVRNIYGLVISTLQLYMPEKSFKVTLPAKRPVKRTVPTDNEIKALVDKANHDLKKAIMLGSLGLRRGEVCAVTYEDIKDGHILITKDMVQNKNGTWIIKNIPKTSSSVRAVQLPQNVIEVLGTGTGNIYPYNPNSLTQAFTRLRDSLNIDVSFHSLRRYMASILHALNMPEKYIQSVGGWSSPSVMRNCYESVLGDKNVEYNEKMKEYYNKNLF